MKTSTIYTGIFLFAVWMSFGCAHGNAAAAEQASNDPAVDTIRAQLAASPQTLLPELAAHTPAEWAAMPHGAALLAWARETDADTTIPGTTYTLYRRYRVAGERPPYETPYFAKRRLLTRAVLSAWFEPTEERLNRVNDLLWSICEETTWVLPAHEASGKGYIDLFAAETGADLAHILALLGDRLNEEIRTRIGDELRIRIFDPYLAHDDKFWWGSGRNNWTGVCAGSVGQALLLQESDPERLARGIAAVIAQLDRFIAKAFAEDGGSLEGIGYWNYGLKHFVGFAEMWRDRTRGAADLLANPKLAAIARYPLAAYLGHGYYASFADAHEHASIHPFLAARLAERCQVPGLLGLADDGHDWCLSSEIRNLAWCNDGQPEAPALEDVFLPDSGIARFTAPPCVLAIKAGDNDEPHNHNDIGSFVLAADGQVYLCDPGGGLYDRSYFSSKRYENVFANSYGHSVPRIGDTLQKAGAAYGGTIERTGDKSVHIRFEKAYGLRELTEASRDVTLGASGMDITDRFVFSGAGQPVEEAFVTWQRVEADGRAARITTDTGAVEITADQGTFTVEPLEEACKANHRDDLLTRIALSLPAAPASTVHFTFAYKGAR